MLHTTDYEKSEEHWFALQVKCQHERMIAEVLQNKRYEAFAPRSLRRDHNGNGVQETDAVLFPGYVFAKFDPRFRLPLLMTPGVRAVVSYGRTPAPLSAREIDDIKHVLECRVPLEPCPYLAEGDHVRIVKGPLKGLEGVLLQFRSSCRVVLSVSLIRRSVRVDVQRDILALGADPEPGRRYGIGRYGIAS
jgi:transcription antitermination factor NusG